MNRRGNNSQRSDETEEKIEEVVEDTRKFLEKAFEDIGERELIYQIMLGSLSGFMTGFVVMKYGPITGFGIGSGSMLFHWAQQNKYVALDYDKIEKKVNKALDKIEEQVSGSPPGMADRLGRFVDRKMDKVENLLKKKQKKATKWYHAFTGYDHFKFTETHVFVTCFVAGLIFGMWCWR